MSSILKSEPNEFDLSAAWYRRAQGDLKAFLEGLAVRLDSAFPGLVEIERKRDGLFSRSSHVQKLSVIVNECRYELSLTHGRLAARRARAIRGVTLKNEELPVPMWLSLLRQDVTQLGTEAGDARDVIHDFLMS